MKQQHLDARSALLRSLALALFLVVPLAQGDDTDLYLDPVIPSGQEPLVMFTLDYRANMEANQCNPANTVAGIQTTCAVSERIATALFADGAALDGSVTLFELIRAAIGLVVDAAEGVKIGLMMSHEDAGGTCAGPPGSSGCSNGAMILMGFRSLQAGDANGAKARFKQILRNIPAKSAPGLPDYHPYQLKEMYFELFRYLTGQRIWNAHNGWRDFDDSNAASIVNLNQPEPADLSLQPETMFYPTWDTSIESGAHYRSPLVDCTRVFVVNIGFGTANQDDDSDGAIADDKNSGGLGLALGGSNEQAQLVEFFRDADFGDGTWGAIPDLEGTQSVVSYFVMQSANNTQDEWALGGGTGNAIELGTNADAMVNTLSNIFRAILSLSTTFVAPSIPVNVFNRSQTLNEVFLAVFEADENGLPLWPGNLKKLAIGTNALGRLELQDAQSPPIQAIDVDGRIKREALTFWTDANTLPAPGDDEVALRDGRAVARGGAGQKVPGFVAGFTGDDNGDGLRRLFTDDAADAYPDGVTDGLMPLDAIDAVRTALWSEITEKWNPPVSSATAAGASPAERTTALHILRFARGLRDDGLTVRPWVVADSLHSRPSIVNYGARALGYSGSNPDIRILLGTNDGIMHMFRNTDASGGQDGSESWGFVPRQVLPMLDRLRSNTAGSPVHPITMDGTPVVLTVDGNFDGSIKSGTASDKAMAFFGMRRGGKTLYALDIKDPDNPKLAWTINGGTGDFAQLTQTWSTPQLGKVRLGSATATPTPVLIFGGGYNGDDGGTGTYAACDAITAGTDANADGVDDRDACFAALGKDAKNRATREDLTPDVGSDDDEGNAVFIVNAETGALIWKFVDGAAGVDLGAKSRSHPLLDDSIAADLVAVDTRGDGVTDRVYATDTAGTVWRIDLVGLVDDDNDASTPDVLVSHEPEEWTITALFTSGRQDPAHTTIADDRRMFNRVDVVLSRDDRGPFDAILVGSGDREDPQGDDVNNWFYLIKDRHTTSGIPPTTEPDGSSALPMEVTDLPDLSSNCLQSGTVLSCGITGLENGWRIALSGGGEKNLASAVTAGGTVFFTTFEPTPSSSACGLSEGTGRIYAVNLQDATAVVNFDTTNDTPSQVVYERSDELASPGIPVEVVPLGGGLILVQGQEAGDNIISAGLKTGFRSYWHEFY
jgi:type IV pilus assembly protein PilY1